MYKPITIIWLLLCVHFMAQAQITISPAVPLSSQEIEIIFDAGKGNKALFSHQGAVYFHAGLITQTSKDVKDWKFVQGNWGKADPAFLMESLGGDKYKIAFVPEAFFAIDSSVIVKQIAIVFRDEKGEKVAKDSHENDFLINLNGYKPPIETTDSLKYTSRNYIDYRLKDDKLEVITDQGAYVFQFYTSRIIKTKFIPNFATIADTSIAVISIPEKMETEFLEKKSELVWRSGLLKLVVQKQPFKVSYYRQDQLLLEEELGFFEKERSGGIRFKLNKEEAIYGTGERAIPLNRRGYKLDLYNRPDYNYGKNAKNLNYTLPVLLSNKKYLLFIDNPQKAVLDIGETQKDILEFSAIGGEMKYFVVAGNTFEEISESFTHLVGRQPLPPRWALGNLQSRMAYRTQKQVEEVVEEMIAKDFPLDAIIIDFYWFGDSIKGYLGNLKWYKKNWPNPEKMISKLKNQGVKTILITEPFVIDTSYWFVHGDTSQLFATHKNGETYVLNDFYFGKAALMDMFKPTTKDWFWQQYKKQIDIGVAGWWGDLGEPETHPADMYHVNGKAEEVHNMYAHEWAKMVYENYQQQYPHKRLFHLNRSGATGTQRYSIFPWSGDVSRSWSGLQAQLPLMLNMSLCGLPYISSDLGGFALGEKEEELYTRWLQMGVFNPIFRPHGSGIPSEPIFFAPQTQDIVREAIKLRYRLMPYIYNTAYENTTSGKPIVKPLFYYHNNSAFENKSDLYYFGDEFIVAPIVEKGQRQKDIMLPKGYWFDFYSTKIYEGNTDYKLPIVLQHIPVFVKAGSFVPMLNDFQSMDQYPENQLIMHYYAHDSVKESHYQLFEDDGEDAQNLVENNYQLIHFGSKRNDKELHISVEKERKEYTTSQNHRKITWVIHNVSQEPNKLIINGETVSVAHYLAKILIQGVQGRYNPKEKILTIEMDFDEVLDLRIRW